MPFTRSACVALLFFIIATYALFSVVGVKDEAKQPVKLSRCQVNMNSVSSPPEKQCSWEVFREEYERNHYFPQGGSWEFPNNESVDGTFIPEACSFVRKETFGQRGLRCFRKMNLTKIVTMGDSNGAGYFRGLWRYVETFSDLCELVKKEMTEQDFVPDKEYFSHGRELPSRALTISRRTCRTCVARNQRCTLANLNGDSEPQNVTIEHLALTSLNDTTLITLPPDRGGVPRVTPTASTAEFYLKVHLKNKMPDVLIIAPPFVHERETAVEDLAALLRSFRDLIATHVPSSVKVVWIPQLTTWRYPDPIFHNMTANEKNAIYNRELFLQLRSSIGDPSSSWFGFYDLQSVTCPLEAMSKDGVHLDPMYYAVMMQHVIMLLCSDL